MLLVKSLLQAKAVAFYFIKSNIHCDEHTLNYCMHSDRTARLLSLLFFLVSSAVWTFMTLVNTVTQYMEAHCCQCGKKWKPCFEITESFMYFQIRCCYITETWRWKDANQSWAHIHLWWCLSCLATFFAMVAFFCWDIATMCQLSWSFSSLLPFQNTNVWVSFSTSKNEAKC